MRGLSENTRQPEGPPKARPSTVRCWPRHPGDAVSERRVVLDVRTATVHFPGIGRAAVELARALADSPFSRRLTLLHGAPPHPRLPLAAVDAVMCPASPFELAQQWLVPKRLRDAGAALYHSLYYLMPARPGVPSIVHCYDMTPLTVAGLFDWKRRLAYRLAHALAFRAASAIVVPSHATGDDVARLFPRHAPKLHVIPLGSSFVADEAAERSGDSVSAPIPGRFVLHVGTNKPHKNLGLLLDAWQRLLAERRSPLDGVSLVLAGPRDPRFDSVRKTIAALGPSARIVETGYVSDADLRSLYSRAELLVLPSRAEGFGFPVLEAMSVGTPVLCSRIPVLVELAGDAAAYFDPKDCASLASSLAHRLDAVAETLALGAAGRLRAREFTWTAIADAHRRLYDDVLGRHE
jgi:glycosyltransferase involved in cell wall biosynthesis